MELWESLSNAQPVIGRFPLKPKRAPNAGIPTEECQAQSVMRARLKPP